MNELPPRADKNGKGAAAIMAAALGSLALGIFSLAGDASPAAAAFFDIWMPTGPLSGVTDLAIAVWLVSWLVLARRWAARDVSLKRVNTVAAMMVAAALLLTFPPVMDLVQGR